MASARKVLIVDDNVDAADLTATLLRLHGLDVDVAYGGQEGLDAARMIGPNIIFLDLGMPIMDGYQVAKAVRADEKLVGVRIVALTAWGDAGSREKSRLAGFDEHLTKPASLSSLIEFAS